MASCSSDHKIKVWDKDPASGKWKCTAEWKAHQAPVWKLVWAHPEYGQLLASCSFDRTVVIWEDRGRQGTGGAAPSALPPSDSTVRAPFQMKGSRLDFNQAVNDIAFSPRHVGLQLAAATNDGFVTVYEFIDVMDMAQPRVTKFEASKKGATAIAWSSARFCVPMIVVGTSEGSVNIWGYSDTFRRWQRLFDLVGNGHSDTVHDVAWAPDIGRSSHVIASCSKDRTLRVWNIDKEQTNPSTPGDSKSRELVATQVLTEHNAEVWRVQFNVTGTTLASSGDDGTVRVWKQDVSNKWTLDGMISGERFARPQGGASD